MQVPDDTLFEGKRFEGVSCRMSQIQCLAQSFFCGVFQYDALFYGYTLRDGIGKTPALHVYLLADQCRPHLLVADEAVLQHLCIA